MSEPDSKMLDGKSFQYAYEDGGKVLLTFYDGKLKYNWLEGIFKGVEESGLTYIARRVSESQYLVNWYDKGNNNFVTLLIDLHSLTLYSSALLYFNSEKEGTFFDEANIENTV